jgi:hypothetical protein
MGDESTENIVELLGWIDECLPEAGTVEAAK